MKTELTDQVGLFGIVTEEPKPIKLEKPAKKPEIIHGDMDVSFEPVEKKGKILTVRGTNGSGKTFIARKIKESYQQCRPIYESGRSRPLYYILSHPGRN